MDIIFIIIHFNLSFHVKLSYCIKKTKNIFCIYKHNKTNGFLLHNYPVTVHTNLYSLYNLIPPPPNFLLLLIDTCSSMMCTLLFYRHNYTYFTQAKYTILIIVPLVTLYKYGLGE